MCMKYPPLFSSKAWKMLAFRGKNLWQLDWFSFVCDYKCMLFNILRRGQLPCALSELPPCLPIYPRGWPHTPSEFYSCSLARREGGGETQMRTESLCSAVSQILLEAQELMNAARSQCVAQQLQLYSTHYLTETALKMKIKEENEEWLTK